MTSIMTGYHADDETYVHLCDYGIRRPPILSLSGPDASLTISSYDNVPITEQLQFARALARAATGYLAATERYAAANRVDLTKAA